MILSIPDGALSSTAGDNSVSGTRLIFRAYVRGPPIPQKFALRNEALDILIMERTVAIRSRRQVFRVSTLRPLLSFAYVGEVQGFRGILIGKVMPGQAMYVRNGVARELNPMTGDDTLSVLMSLIEGSEL